MNSTNDKQFWDKYIEKTLPYNVPGKPRRWYIRRVEEYIGTALIQYTGTLLLLMSRCIFRKKAATPSSRIGNLHKL